MFQYVKRNRRKNPKTNEIIAHPTKLIAHKPIKLQWQLQVQLI